MKLRLHIGGEEMSMRLMLPIAALSSAALSFAAAAPAQTPAPPKFATPTSVVAELQARRMAGDPGRRSDGHRPEGRQARSSSSSRRCSRQFMSPTSARWPNRAIGRAPPSIACRTIMSRNGAITRASKPLPAGVVAKPPAEYHRSLRGLRITPLGSPDSYAPKRRLHCRLARCLRSQGRDRQSAALLRLGRGRARPVARHRHGRRALCRDRPCAAPASTG